MQSSPKSISMRWIEWWAIQWLLQQTCEQNNSTVYKRLSVPIDTDGYDSHPLCSCGTQRRGMIQKRWKYKRVFKLFCGLQSWDQNLSSAFSSAVSLSWMQSVSELRCSKRNNGYILLVWCWKTYEYLMGCACGENKSRCFQSNSFFNTPQDRKSQMRSLKRQQWY